MPSFLIYISQPSGHTIVSDPMTEDDAERLYALSPEGLELARGTEEEILQKFPCQICEGGTKTYTPIQSRRARL